MSADQDLPDVVLAVTAEFATPSVVVVRPVGDVDTATVGQLRTAVDEGVAGGAQHVVLDLAGVAFLGSAGLALLIEQREAAELRAGSLRLASVPRTVARPLAMTGLDELFAAYDDVTSAVADLP